MENELPKIWTDDIEVRTSDTDINGIASASSVLRYMQNAAFNQHFGVGPTIAELRASGKVYILSRIAMRSLTPLYPLDRISVATWACPSRGVSFTRCSRITRGGQTVAELSSVWAMVHPDTRKFCRTDELHAKFGTDEPIDPGVPIRFTLPELSSMELAGSRVVRYSDADENGHMNNTVYPDMLCDFLPEDRSGTAEDDGGFVIHADHRPYLTGRRVTAFSISYLTEARIGDCMDVYRARDESGAFFFRTRHGDPETTGVEVRMETSPIE